MQLLLQHATKDASMSASPRRPCRCCGCGMRTVREFEQARRPTKGKSAAAARPTSPKLCAARASEPKDCFSRCISAVDVGLSTCRRQRPWMRLQRSQGKSECMQASFDSISEAQKAL